MVLQDSLKEPLPDILIDTLLFDSIRYAQDGNPRWTVIARDTPMVYAYYRNFAYTIDYHKPIV